MKLVRSIFLSLAAIPFLANGATMYGYGNDSCGTWINEHKVQSEKSRYQEVWVLGFISGSGVIIQAFHKTQRMTDADAAFAYIDKYCNENPLEKISTASQDLVSKLL